MRALPWAADRTRLSNASLESDCRVADQRCRLLCVALLCVGGPALALVVGEPPGRAEVPALMMIAMPSHSRRELRVKDQCHVCAW